MASSGLLGVVSACAFCGEDCHEWLNPESCVQMSVVLRPNCAPPGKLLNLSDLQILHF